MSYLEWKKEKIPNGLIFFSFAVFDGVSSSSFAVDLCHLSE